MAIQNNFPALKPTLLLDFANVERLDPRVSFARASAATYYGTQTAKAEENLLLQSQAFDSASWVNQNATETDNAATAPDGTTTAATLNDGTDTGGHDIGSQGPTITAGVTYTASAFFKDVDRQFVILACSTGPNTWASAKFNLTAGTAGSTSTSGAGWSVTSSSITAVGNSWFRCTLTFVSGLSSASSVRLGMATDGTTFTAGQRGLESYTGSNKTIQIWGAQLEERSAVTAYTPTTTQPITNYIPVLESAAAGEARFDHNPNTFESLGLLIEEQRTNLLVQSEDFSTTWSMVGTASIVPDTVIAPTGALTADKFVLGNTITSNNAAVNQSATKPAVSAPYTASVYIKEGEFNSLRLILRDAANASNLVQAFFNASTGVIAQAASAGGTFTAASATITPVGNGWYRCSVTGTTSTETSLNVRIFNYQNGTDLATGDGFSGIFLWGASLEQGAFPTSYVKTTTAQVTRAADAASMTGANFSSFYNQAEGTLYGEFVRPSLTAVSVVAQIDDNTANNRISVQNTTGAIQQFVVTASGVNQAVNIVSGAALTNSVPFKLANSFKVDSFATTTNASAVVTDTSGVMPVVDRLRFGENNTGGAKINGTIKKLAFYPKTLTAAELQSLTG